MRLLNVHTLQFQQFYGNPLPYAVASHRWDLANEAMLRDVQDGNAARKSGFEKVEGFVAYVRQNLSHIDWLWIDTCCIDQSSSQEVTEAVNAMFFWYARAEVCLAYLADVRDAYDLHVLRQSEWFQRGWTLQELLAPHIVLFLTRDWQLIGSKGSDGQTRSGVQISYQPQLEDTVAEITGIPHNVLCDFRKSDILSVSDRLTWIANRKTTREEDMSYSMLGIFGVTMPVIYGEGAEQARSRLLRKISKATARKESLPFRPTACSVPRNLFDEVTPSKRRELLNICEDGGQERALVVLKRSFGTSADDENWLTALHYACFLGLGDVVRALLRGGADIDAQSKDLGTPLCMAALHGQDEIVKLLLGSHAAVHKPGAWVGSPLHCASWQGKLSTAKILIHHGANPRLSCPLQFEVLQFGAFLSPWRTASTPGKFSAWNYRILNCQPMVIAADKGHRDLVQFYLSLEYPVNSPHSLWWTASPDVNPHLEDPQYEECTALMSAAWAGNHGILRDLLAAGAKVDVVDSGGRSAISLARQAGNREACDILEDAGRVSSQV